MGCSGEAIADHWAFVVGAYLTAFGAWAGASVYDFITPTWTTVGDVRRHGLYHLIALVVPMAYMVVYIKFQAQSCDYKEMSSGILALLFASVDFGRTVMGLWQLHMFKQWVMRGVRSIESLGYIAGLGEKRDGSPKTQDKTRNLRQGVDRLNKIADSVRINDMIVENRLTEGAVRCFVRCRNVPTGKGAAQGLLWLLRWIEALFQLPRVLFRSVIRKSALFSNKDLKIVLQPSQPEDIWLRWACVLLSQVFPKLPQDMKKSGFLGSSKDSTLEASAFELAKGILISAALNTQGTSTIIDSESESRDKNGSGRLSSRCLPHEFLDNDMWEKYPDLCRGIFSQQEFLKQACTTGSGLPFGAPHPKAKIEANGKTQYTYSKYETKLERAREMLTVEDFESLGDFNTDQLEWLAVVLSVENWNPTGAEAVEDIGAAVDCESEEVGTDEGNDSEMDTHSTDLRSEDSVADARVTDAGHGSATSIALENLVVQLGVQDNSEFRYFGGEAKSINRFPLLQGALKHKFLDNRNVLETSAHIDNALALCAGDQYAFMMEKERTATGRILEARRFLELENPFFSSTLQAGEGTSSDKVMSPAGKNEQERLLYQFVKHSPEFSYLDQRMTFLGCNMESLRSKLAEWAERNSETQQSFWEPNIASPDVFKELSFSASDSFRRCVGAFPFTVPLSKRYTQMWLLFEIQQHLHMLASEKSLSPSCTEAMALCVLSFPSLRATVRANPLSENSEPEVANVENGCSVMFHSPSVREPSSNETWISFAVPLSPQPVHIPVKLEREENDGVTISFSVAVDSGENLTSFEWETWRTNYLDRLTSVQKWQREHNMPSAPLTETVGKICRGVGAARVSGTGTGQRMKVWLGWLPPRPNLGLFELKTSGFITRMVNMKYAVPVEWAVGGFMDSGIEKKRPVPQSYDAASNADLEHAASVECAILEIIAEALDGGETTFTVDGKQILLKDDGKGEKQLRKISNSHLRLLEAVSVHTGRFSSLRTAVEHLLQLGGQYSSGKRAVQMMETFCATVGVRTQMEGLGFPRLYFHDGAMAQDLFELFQTLMVRTRHASVVAESIAKVCSSFENYQGDTFINHASRALLQTILRCSWSNSPARVDILKNVLGRILSRTRARNHALPMHLVCGENIERINVTEWYSLGKAERSGKNGMLSPELSLDVFCCGIFAAQGPYSTCVAGGGTQWEDALSRSQLPSDDSRHVLMMCAQVASLINGYNKGVRRNQMTAVRLLQYVLKSGKDFDAMFNLALLLQNGGEGVEKDVPRAVQLLSRATEGGHVKATFNLALLLQNGGEGVEKDVPRAVQLYSRAIDDGGSVRFMFNLASLLENGGEGVEKDVPRAVQLYSRAIDDGGHVGSMYNLALLLRNGGEGVEKDVPRAVQLYSRAIDEGGDVMSMFNLANLLRNGGEGIEKDVPRAVQLYSRAIDREGDVKSMLNLAILLRNGGDGIEKDVPRAVQLYSRAIDEEGSVKSMFNLASLLDEGGDGVEQDVPRAVQLYSRAIDDGGHVGSMFNLALLLQNGGEGVEKDVSRAVKLLSRAIDDGGHVPSMFNLAVLFQNGGEGIEKDVPRAVHLYSRAIDREGDVKSMSNLAVLLRNGGDGIEKDVPRAVQLYSRAIDEGGEVKSMFNLASLLDEGGDGVEQDVPRAVQLYSRAIDDEGHVGSMFNLALLLTNGWDCVEKDVPRAAQLYSRAIDDGGHVPSMLNLAVVLQNGGNGVDKDVPRAVQLYSRSIDDGGEVRSMFNLAVLLQNGVDGVDKDVPRAAQLYLRAICDGEHFLSMLNLSNLLDEGLEGVEKDTSRAVELYTAASDSAARHGALTPLGNAVVYGALGVISGASRAEQLFSRAIEEKSCTDAMNSLGLLLETGLPGVNPDSDRAADLYSQAGAGQNEYAKYNLAVMKTFGADRLPPDLQSAVLMYKELLSSLHHKAQAANNLGVLCEHGHVDSEGGLQSATSLYRRSFGYEEHPGALYNLAVLLNQGASDAVENGAEAANVFARAVRCGGPVCDDNFGEFLRLHDAKSIRDDRSGAVLRYKRAIMQDHDVRAMNNLAVLLYKGVPGVAADPERAVRLLKRSIWEGGHVGAMENLSEILESGGAGIEVDTVLAERMRARARCFQKQ